MGITFVFPDAADLSDDTLATKPHSELHGDLGDTLEAYIAALGKVTASGFNYEEGGAIPTLFDPAQTAWNDGAWWTFNPTEGLIFAGKKDHNWAALGGTDNGTAVGGVLKAFAESDDGTKFGSFTMTATEAHDGSDEDLLMDINMHNGGEITARVRSTTQGAGVSVFGNNGQTGDLLGLFNWNGDGILTVAPDGSVGGVAPSPGDSIKWDGTKWAAAA